MSAVRPTKRCLDDLGLRFPPLEVPLPDTEHDLIAKAQRLPDESASGGAERVLAIDDRVWFKVKVGEYRGAGGWVVDVPDDISPLWWISRIATAPPGVRCGLKVIASLPASLCPAPIREICGWRDAADQFRVSSTSAL